MTTDNQFQHSKLFGNSHAMHLTSCGVGGKIYGAYIEVKQRNHKGELELVRISRVNRPALGKYPLRPLY